MGTNTRSMIRCILPCDYGIFQREQHEQLRRKLCAIAGGYTSYAGNGGWNGKGYMETEPNIIYEVSFPPSDNIKYSLITVFAAAGAAQGEQETYIEYHAIAFEAYHAKTG